LGDSLARLLSPLAGAFCIACLAAALAILSTGYALGQFGHKALTEQQIEGVIAASKEMNAIIDKIPDHAKPDAKVDAQLDALAKKYGFDGFAEYNDVTDNISVVLGGFDPKTRKYVGVEAVLKEQIAAVQADKKMPPKDKKAALAEMNEALKIPAPVIEYKGNIDLVAKYYDRLIAAMSP
jgi:hypothetical protein